HVELGRGVHRHRPCPPRREQGPHRTRHPAVRAMVGRHDPPHRLHRRHELLPRPRPVGTDSVPQRPPHVRTSGICQPPVHAIALRRIVDIARHVSRDDVELAETFAARTWPALYRWHRWLARHRMSESCGLITIVHGWESGMDNSPRWDAPYAHVQPGPDLPPYVRLDLDRKSVV